MALSSSLDSLLRVALLSLCLLRFASSDFASERAACSKQLTGLADCLAFVQGSAQAPTPDCCTNLKQVVAKSFMCLCGLIKNRNDPELGIKVNVTRAVLLPSSCNVPANISDCPRLLKLAPNSAAAKEFKQYAAEAEANYKNGNGKGNATSNNITSGGRRLKWLEVEMSRWLSIRACFLLLMTIMILS